MRIKENIFLFGLDITYTLNWVHSHVSDDILISSVLSMFWYVSTVALLPVTYLMGFQMRKIYVFWILNSQGIEKQSLDDLLPSTPISKIVQHDVPPHPPTTAVFQVSPALSKTKL